MWLINSRNFNLFLKRFFTSFLRSSSETVKTTVSPIRHRTCVQSSPRSRGSQSSESKIFGKLLSHTLITMSVAGGAAGTGSRKNLKENERRAVIDELLEGSKKGKLACGDIKRVAQQFACSRKQVATVRKRYKEQKDAGIAAPSLRSKRGENSGKKGIDLEELRDKLRHKPLKNRTTQRAVAAQLGIPHTTLTDNLKKLGLYASRRYLKPLLTDGGKAARLAWALRWVRQSAAVRVFDDMKGVVMVDEKWFYKFRQGQNYYLCEGEQLPVAKVQQSHTFRR